MQVDEATARLTISELVSILVLAILLLTLPELRGSDLTFRHASGMRLLVCSLELTFVLSVALNPRIVWLSVRDLPPSIKWLGGCWALWTTLSVVLASHQALAVVRQTEWWITVLFGFSLWSFL